MRQRRRSTTLPGLAAAAAVAAALACGGGAPDEPAAGPSGPDAGGASAGTEPEGPRRYLNEAAGYSLAIPEGWALRAGSGQGIVVLDREGSDAALAILAKQARGSLEEEYGALREALLDEQTGFRAVDEAELLLADHPARLLVTEKTIEDNPRVTYNWVVVAHETTYVLGSEMPRARREELHAEAAGILESMVLFAPRPGGAG